jgi:hypothetical protein
VKAYIPAPAKIPAITTDATATSAIELQKIKKPVVKSLNQKNYPHKTAEEEPSEF